MTIKPVRNYFGTAAATLATELAAEKARISKRNSERYEMGYEDDSFVSQQCESMLLSEMGRALELAQGGWRVGFVGLCRLDGTPAKGRWVDGKWGASWMTETLSGERVFIKADVIYNSRSGKEGATAKLLAMGFHWESRRLPANVGYAHPDGAKGFAGLWSASLVVFPCGKHGEQTCLDALVYAAETFFIDGASDMAHGLERGDADLYENGVASVADLNTPRRRAKKAA